MVQEFAGIPGRRGYHNLLTTVVEFDPTVVVKFVSGTGSQGDDRPSSTDRQFLAMAEAQQPTACGARGTAPLCGCRSGIPTTVSIVDCQFMHVNSTSQSSAQVSSFHFEATEH
jgi:hypothetical protein